MGLTSPYNFTTLNGSDAAGHESINTCITSINNRLNTASSGLSTAAVGGSITSGYTLVFTSGTFAAAQLGSAGIATSAIIADKIATGAVTSDKILDGTIVNADINSAAAINDTKLATISTAGKVSNSATTATDANTVSAIVSRDASGNFSAGTITASLSGTATSLAGGSAASVPYQSATGVTAMLANGTAGQVLTSGGTSVAPSWQAASIGIANIALNAISQDKMADNSVGTAEIIDANVTYAKLASNAKTYSVATTATAGLHFTSSGNFTTASLSTSSSQNPLVITTHSSGTITLTIPYQLTTTPGTTITVCRYNGGNVTISTSNGTSGTQLNGETNGTATIGGQYSIITLILLPDIYGDGLDHWVITGDYA